MPMPDRFSIDTNILIYSVDADAGERHEQAMALRDDLAERQ
jgi:predicted nucleic acid-binding protein